MRTALRLLITFAALLAFAACEESVGCTDDYDCEGALVCHVASNTCEPLECGDDDDCLSSQMCEDNRCIESTAGE